MTKLIAPVSPGEMLEEEFLSALGHQQISLRRASAFPLSASAISFQASAELPQTRTFASAASSACLMVGGCASR